MKLQNYLVTSLEGEEKIYNAKMSIIGPFINFTVRDPKTHCNSLIIYSSGSIVRIETIEDDDPPELDPIKGAIVIPYRQFKSYSETMDAFDAWIKSDNPDPASLNPVYAIQLPFRS